MLGCNEVATRGERGEVTDWVVTGGGHPPLSASSTNLVTGDIFICYMLYVDI